MKTRFWLRCLAALVPLLLVGAPRSARAAHSEYDPLSGHGSYSARAGLTAEVFSGTLPMGNTPLAGKTFTAEFNALLFEDHTVFGTLLGIEFDAALGLRLLDSPKGAVDPDDIEGTSEDVRPTGKMDFEFAYDLVRWKLLALRQRIILNAGGGFDLQTLPWQLIDGSSGWRAYPLLGGHVQTSVGSQVSLDVSYRFVPTQSKDAVGAEHRVQVSLNIMRLVVGAHFITTRLLPRGSAPVDVTQLGGFAAWAL